LVLAAAGITNIKKRKTQQSAMHLVGLLCKRIRLATRFAWFSRQLESPTPKKEKPQKAHRTLWGSSVNVTA
jgi:hypothetical protein